MKDIILFISNNYDFENIFRNSIAKITNYKQLILRVLVRVFINLKTTYNIESRSLKDLISSL